MFICIIIWNKILKCDYLLALVCISNITSTQIFFDSNKLSSFRLSSSTHIISDCVSLLLLLLFAIACLLSCASIYCYVVHKMLCSSKDYLASFELPCALDFPTFLSIHMCLRIVILSMSFLNCFEQRRHTTQ